MATPDENERMTELCAAIGELILLSTRMDQQLAEAIVFIFVLKPAKMLIPVVSEIETRRKIDLLKARVRKLEPPEWRGPLLRWCRHAEKVNGYRNFVAHHQVVEEEGNFILFSPQAGKLIKGMDAENTDAAKVLTWVNEAEAVLEEGQNVLQNLAPFAAEAAAAGL